MSKAEAWYIAELAKANQRIAHLERENARYLQAIKDLRGAVAMIEAIAQNMEVDSA